ncbi:hypothetical protein [Glycomyces salinus]|uniref:hypothetical protein n=1 Tax=Glycomyces salinus TaxID=980294 RepID=UPI0018EDEBF2|nr:hypothetical protein [Glycomyces salinus]
MKLRTVYREDKTAERTVVNADQDLGLRRQLRLVAWRRCAFTYLTVTAIAASVLITDARGHEIAFPVLSLYLVAGHALWFAPPARHLLRHAPPAIRQVTLTVPTGLLVGGLNIRGYWIDDPWFWISAALAALMMLRVFRPQVATWIHERRQRRGGRAK